MNHDQFAYEVRCPVHGFIGLTELERKIIDHPAFQRLRRIKQLAWTDYVYPGASHSRFEHSLGVMHIATRLYEAIVKSSESTLKEIFGYTDAGLSRDWQIVRLAALLHDIGHAPFSHATEHLLPMKKPENYSLFTGVTEPIEQYEHEDYSVAIIEKLLADLIEQDAGNRRNMKITATEVTALIAKRASGGGSLFWKDIISGQLDADRMDYLLRDSLHAGVSYGKFDLDRIVSSVCAIRRPEEESGEPKIAIMRGGAYAAEALIVARYWMHKQVYFHKTRLACNFHLEKAVGEILSKGKPADETTYYPRPESVEQLQEFLKWDDYRIMNLLTNGEGGEHGERLMTRNHYRLVCELEESDATVTELDRSAKRNAAIIDSLAPMVKHVVQPKTLWYKTKAELVLVDDHTKQQIGYLSQYSALVKPMNVGSLKFVYVDKTDVVAARKSYEVFLREEAKEQATAPNPELVAEEQSSAIRMSTPISGPLSVEPLVQNTQLTLDASPMNGKSVQRETLPKKGVQDVV